MTKKHRLLKRSERWRTIHLWAGLTSALVLFSLVITGILLNHTDDLRLDARHVTYTPLLKWYGFKPPGRIVQIDLKERELLQLDEAVLLNGDLIFESIEPISAACDWQGLISLVTQAEIALFMPTGELVEAVALPEFLAGRITRVACRPAGPIISSADKLYGTDQRITDWHRVAGQADLSWPDADPKSSPDQSTAYALYHQQSLSWERLLLDLHSGRLLGLPGVLLVDTAALLLLLQLLSGVYLFWVKGR